MKSNTRHNAIRLSEVLGKEEGLLTSISMQKKNSNRFSIFVDEIFMIGVSDSCLVTLNLKKGMEFDQVLLDKIQSFEERWAVREYVLRLLSRRDHATFELKQKASKKGFSSHQIDDICSELEVRGYINNAEFAKKFARDKFEFNKWGTQKIRMELLKKGIQASHISSALLEISKDDQSTTMQHLFSKSKLKFLRVEPSKRRKKIFDFFLRKGYDSEQILSALPKWITELES